MLSKINRIRAATILNRINVMTEYYNDGTLRIRSMEEADAKVFYETYLSYGWHPSMATYENYFKEQIAGERMVFCARV